MTLLAASTPAFAADYQLPFTGRWFVAQGGDTPNVNQHVRVPAQWYAIDFMKAGGENGRSPVRSNGGTIEDFYSWGESVLAPAEGEIVNAVDEFPDNPLGTKDAKNPAGNYVVIKAAADRFVFVAHLQKGSVAVKTGDHVQAGQLLGKCGNSGNSDAPHIHMHVQKTPVLNEGHGQNMIFRDIDVELTRQTFTKVTWPLIRGLFVSPSAK